MSAQNKANQLIFCHGEAALTEMGSLLLQDHPSYEQGQRAGDSGTLRQLLQDYPSYKQGQRTGASGTLRQLSGRD